MNNRLHYRHGSIKRAQIGNYIVDFVCWKQKLVVELDGSQHYTHQGKEHDRVRDQFLNQQGFRVLRFQSAEALKYTDGILNIIFEYLENPLLSPYEGDRGTNSSN